MPPDDPYALVGTTLERRFAVERVVARGGFGIVYYARHLSLQRPVALKVLFVPDSLSPDQRHVFLDGFTQEAQTIAALDHAAIVRVFDFGVSQMPGGGESPWMALEWIEGTPLSAAIKARRGVPMSPAEVLATLRPVFEALAFAHESGVAHRDVKPANIMLATIARGAKAGGSTARLLDFGIAKVMGVDEGPGTGDTRTEALLTALSLPYASPEQRTLLRTGPWTDVHALGLIVTELLVGRRAYPTGDRLTLETAILSPMRPTPGTFSVDVGPWEAVIAKALAHRAPDRYPNAAAFLEALEAKVPTARSVTPNVRGDTEPLSRGDPSPGQTITAPPTISTVPPPPRRWRRGVTMAILGLAAVLLGVMIPLLRRDPTEAMAPPLSDAGLHAGVADYELPDATSPGDASWRSQAPPLLGVDGSVRGSSTDTAPGVSAGSDPRRGHEQPRRLEVQRSGMPARRSNPAVAPPPDFRLPD